MKKLFFLLPALIILIACNGQGDQPKLNLAKGETYFQNMVSKTSIQQNVMGQEMNIDITIKSKISYKVAAVKDTVYDLEVRYDNMAMEMNMPTGKISVSSETKGGADMMSTMMSGMMANITNKPFNIKMTANGKIMEVKNIDAVFADMFKNIPQLDEAQQQQMLAQMKQSYGEEAFTNNMQMAMAIFPGKPVVKGDKWKQSSKTETGSMPMTVETNYELADITDTYFEIKGDSKIATGKDATTMSGGMALKYDMHGTMISDLKVDKKTGWVTSAKITQNIKGNAAVEDSPAAPGGMSIPMSMKNEMTVTDK